MANEYVVFETQITALSPAGVDYLRRSYCRGEISRYVQEATGERDPLWLVVTAETGDEALRIAPAILAREKLARTVREIESYTEADEAAADVA